MEWGGEYKNMQSGRVMINHRSFHQSFVFIGDERGNIAAILASSLFVGLFLFIIIFSTVIHLGFLQGIGAFRYLFAFMVICFSMMATCMVVKRYIQFRFKNGRYNPLLVRELMKRCIQKDVGRLHCKLNNNLLSPLVVMNEMFQDKMQWIIRDDGRYMSDIRAKYENSRIKKIHDQNFHKFFLTSDQYDLTTLPFEIRLLESAIEKKLNPISKEFLQICKYRKILFTLMGDYLDIFPPSASRVQWIRNTYRYRMPDEEKIRRISFALDFLSYLERLQENTVKSQTKKQLDAVASERIFLLKNAIVQYQKSWYDLSKAYEAVIGGSGCASFGDVLKKEEI